MITETLPERKSPSGQRTFDLLARRQEAVPRGPFNVAPIFAERAEGPFLWDLDGNRYFDFCGGIGVLNVGHNHPRVVEAIRRQSGNLVHSCWHVAMYEPYVELAERLGELVPMAGPNKTVFFNSGAEAGENAVKIARAATGRPAVVTFERGFHGRTLLAMTMTGKVRPYTAGFGPFAPEVYRLPWEPFFGHDEGGSALEVEAECRRVLDKLFTYHVEPEKIACVLVEPVLGEGGFLPARPPALRLLREVCREHEILFGADEVQSGFARCGALFAIERYGIQPDMVLMAKSLAGGLPLSAVSGPALVMDAVPVGGMGGTFGGNPLACAAALAVLDVIEEEGLVDRGRAIGRSVMERFQHLAESHDFLARPRGLGAMCGLEVVSPETGEPDAGLATRLCDAARERGLLMMTASGHVLRSLVPLVIDDDPLDEALGILSAACAAIADEPRA